MMNRDEIRERFSPLLDGELSPDERSAVESALADDSELLRELDALKRVDDLYRALPRATAPETFEHSLHDHIHPKRVTLPSRHVRRRVWPALAAAALVMLSSGIVLYRMQRTDGPFTMATGSMPERVEVQNRAATAQPDPSARPIELDSNSTPSADTPAPFAEQKQKFGAQHLSDVAMAPQTPPPGEAGGDRRDVGATAGAAAMPMSEPSDAAAELHAEKPKALSTPQPVPATPSSREQLLMDESESGMKRETPSMAKEATAPAKDRAGAGIVNQPMAARTAPAPAPPASPSEPARVGRARQENDASSVAESDSASRTVGKRALVMQNGVWVEAGYADQRTTALRSDSEQYRTLRDTEVELDELVALNAPVVFRVKDRWYRLESDQSRTVSVAEPAP